MRNQSFCIERRATTRSRKHKDKEKDISDDWPEDGCVGTAFALRSTRTGRYVILGGWMERSRLLANGEKPEEAYNFAFVPLADPASNAIAEEGSAAEYSFALRHQRG